MLFVPAHGPACGLVILGVLITTVFGGEPKNDGHIVPVAPMSPAAWDSLKKIADDCASKPPAEIREALGKLTEDEQKSVDGVILWASVELAEGKDAEATERLRTLLKRDDVHGVSLAMAGESLVRRKVDLALAVALLERAEMLAPDNLMMLVRISQALCAAGKPDEGFALAEATKVKARRKGPPLAWFFLDSFVHGDLLITAQYSLRPAELNPPEIAITRPITFRIAKKNGKRGEILDQVDFEIAYFRGEAMSAALGKTTPEGHSNYGTLPVDSKYTTIRGKLIELLPTLVKSGP
jgi:hypothetical protein